MTSVLPISAWRRLAGNAHQGSGRIRGRHKTDCRAFEQRWKLIPTLG